LHQSTTHASAWATAPCFNQLVQFDPAKVTAGPQDILPDLAEKWEQPDPSTLLFTLKPGVTFHDGADLTAEDAKVQLDWILNPPQGTISPRRGALLTVDAIETPAPGTLRVRLKRPTPSLLINLASHSFAIGQARDILINGEVGPGLIGTGPFRLKDYQRANLLELERNPTYHVPGRPYLDGLRFSIVPEYDAALSDFIAGRYQLFYDLQFKASDHERVKLEAGARAETELVPSTLRNLLFMNTLRGPYDDPHVRQAISLALDRDAAIKVIREGAGRRGGYMAPKGSWAISEGDLKRYEGYDKPNIEKAKQLLTAAGVTGPLTASSITRTDFQDSGEFIRDQLAKIGVDVRLTLAEAATAQPALQRGDFDISPWLIAINVDDPDATFGEIATSRATRNWSRLADLQIDALFDKQSQMLDLGERKKLVQELEKQALAAYQVVVLFFEDLGFARSTSVQNFVFQESLYTNRRMESVWLQ
ncbi:MAG: ABC transporter substrate-binding protein, partial [Dehalococcoidia bacterium]